MFFPKQFGLQVSNSMHHAILNLIDDILTSFEKSQFTLGIFVLLVIVVITQFRSLRNQKH